MDQLGHRRLEINKHQVVKSKGFLREIDQLGQFDGRISISDHDHRYMLEYSLGASTFLLPMCFDPPAHIMPVLGNIGGILLGDNPLNLEGLSWFLQEALPEIKRVDPAFEVVLAGAICDRLSGTLAGVRVMGRIGCIDEFYEQVGYVICPTYLGTGEQFKIGEAMSFGRATVSFDWMSSPVRDGVEGFRAVNAESFIQSIRHLAEHPALASAFGKAARERIESARNAATWSRSLDEYLQTVAHSRGG